VENGVGADSISPFENILSKGKMKFKGGMKIFCILFWSKVNRLRLQLRRVKKVKGRNVEGQEESDW